MRYIGILVIFAFCILPFNATAKLADGLHIYMAFDDDEGNIAKDVGPKGFEATLHATAKFVEDGKFGGAIEFTAGSAKIAKPGGKSDLYTEHLTVAVWIFPYEISDIVIGMDMSMGTFSSINPVQVMITWNSVSVADKDYIGI